MKHFPHPEFELFRDPAADGGPVRPPGDYIRQELDQRGWGQADLAAVTGRPLPTINEIITGKRAIMAEMAVDLGRAFANPPQLWIHREAAYRLSLVSSRDAKDLETTRLARLYTLAPIKEMERRGWIRPSSSAEALESELCSFFKVRGVEDIAPLKAVARQSGGGEPLSSTQQVWLARSRQLAEIVNVRRFIAGSLEDALPNLKKSVGNKEGLKVVPRILAECGIRLVVVEKLAKGRIDGAAFWLDQSSPVIALSLRFDRLDCFWHTLAHEIRHIVNNDTESLDSDLVGDNRAELVEEFERRADSEAANWLIDETLIRSFIVRAGPYFSKERIVQFSKRVNVHPGIVIGQLHRRNALPYSHLREMLVKVSDSLTVTATTDGFGAPTIQFK